MRVTNKFKGTKNIYVLVIMLHLKEQSRKRIMQKKRKGRIRMKGENKKGKRNFEKSNECQKHIDLSTSSTHIEKMTRSLEV